MKIILEVEERVEELWHAVKNMPKEDLHQEVADWVLDPGTNAGRVVAYNRLLMQYWVNMKMVVHSYIKREANK